MLVEEVKLVVPVDAAIAQCLPARCRTPIYSPNEKEIILTVAGLQRGYIYRNR